MADQGDQFLNSRQSRRGFIRQNTKPIGACQDWETEATFFNWRGQYSEEQALKHMKERWGEELPAKGLLFAMGTHSQYPETWLINALIQMAEVGQLSLDLG
jgi:hypothetical protein